MAPPPVVFVIIIVSCFLTAILPWLYVAYHVDRPVQDVDFRVLSHARGRDVWLAVFLCEVAFLFVLVLVYCSCSIGEAVVTFCLCWSSGLAVLACSWLRWGSRHGIRPGLLAVFFVSGGLLGIQFAMILNTGLILSWGALLPCPFMPLVFHGFDCEAITAVLWICTPGLVEETFKALWLFLRLRKSSDQLPAKCCCCFPGDRSLEERGCGGTWHKLSPTPYHVFLCALSCGAGFECLENLMYSFCKTGSLDALCKPEEPLNLPPVAVAFGRLIPSQLHLVWTGLVGVGLARRMFSAPGQRPNLLTVLLPSMVAHGIYDYCSTRQWLLKDWRHSLETIPWFFFFIIGLSWVSSYGSCARLLWQVPLYRVNALDYILPEEEQDQNASANNRLGREGSDVAAGSDDAASSFGFGDMEAAGQDRLRGVPSSPSRPMLELPTLQASVREVVAS